ncbi:MAG TPA: hypothetical protein VFY89_01515, partial [Ktedonobacterales bacterium]
MTSKRSPDQPRFGALLNRHLQRHHQTVEELASCIHKCVGDLWLGRSPLPELEVLRVLKAVIEREEPPSA